MTEFRRDGVTWVAYLMLSWFAYLQAAPGLVVGHLRSELDLSYSAGGLHVAAFAAGAMVAGLVSARVERVVGRRTLLWSAAAVMAGGTIGLTAAQAVAVTLGSVLLMGLGGGLVLTLVQAALADHHGALRGVALAEANVAASIAYLVLIGGLSVAAALHAGWRVALLVSLLLPVVVWWRSRRLGFDAPERSATPEGPLPKVFRTATAMLFCTTAAEWCITAWGASYVEQATDVATDTAVALMAGYFGGVVVGRIVGSRLARRHQPSRLLGLALAVATVGFAVLWPTTSPPQAVVGLALLGLGLGNLFPMAVSVTVALTPSLAAVASGRAVAMASLAVLLAPVTVGTMADATSMRAALAVVPVLLALAAAALVVVRRSEGRAPTPRADLASR